MGQAVAELRMSLDQFLAWDASQSVRHEFSAGEVFAMAGAEDSHVTVAGNVYVHLRRHLAGTPCRAFMSDMKLLVEAADSVFYPDVMVTCSDADRRSPLYKSEPKLLVEVLSPSTAAFDRGDKFAAYRRLSSLQEYVLIDVKTRRSDVYRRGGDGLWVLHPVDVDQPLQLAAVGLELSPEQLFAEVDTAD